VYQPIQDGVGQCGIADDGMPFIDSLNATAFLSTVEDYQVSIFDGATAFFVQNAAEIESKGVEVDIMWAATDGLTISLAGSYLKAEYTDFPNAPCWTVSGTEPVEHYQHVTFMYVCGGVGGTIAPFASSKIVEWFDISAVYYVCACLYLVILILMTALHFSQKKSSSIDRPLQA
jgi:fucose permease